MGKELSKELINKHRPDDWDQVVGHAKQVKVLERVVKDGGASAFLFTGESGVGKTTLARITASKLGVHPRDLREIDAATHTGIEQMREVLEGLAFKPLGDGDLKGVIVDECHALSAQAFKSLLKTLEEPPPWVRWFLCTTVPTKVPVEIRNRCLHIDLPAVQVDVLLDLLVQVAEKEGHELDDRLADVIELCAETAQGSPRQALSNYVLCFDAENRKAAAELLKTSADTAAAIDLARALVKGTSWRECQELLNKLGDTNPESVRHTVRAYVTKVVLNPKSGGNSHFAILEEFSTPFNSQDGISPLVLACGRLLLR
jgi:DNA polymerase-3 subunit gamma/tau